MSPPHPLWQPPLRHFPLLIFIYTSFPPSLRVSSSSFLPLFPPQFLFFIFYVCQRSDGLLRGGSWPASTHPRATTRSVKKEGGRTLSVVNFNFCAHCRYFGAPLNPSSLCCRHPHSAPSSPPRTPSSCVRVRERLPR